MKLELLTPSLWGDYELIDSGGFEKLERFGRYVTARPEPQAIWDKSLPPQEWRTRADAYFIRDKKSEDRGFWERSKNMPEQWTVDYRYKDMNLRMRLGLTSFKHVGIFPEQAANWNYIYDNLKSIGQMAGGMQEDGEPAARKLRAEGGRSEGRQQTEVRLSGEQAAGGTQKGNWQAEEQTAGKKVTGSQESRAQTVELKAGSRAESRQTEEYHENDRPTVLNLFAYTGGATLAARSAGAAVTHVDSVRQVVSWARENMELSGLDGVRRIVDDALKFARREVNRGSRYNAIILDPPAYGRGPDGEKWVLEENLNELLGLCGRLLKERDSFIVLNLYSMGLSALVARTAVNSLTGSFAEEETGELYFKDSFGKALPLGVFYRGRR